MQSHLNIGCPGRKSIRFRSTSSNELRTPLNAIIGLTEMMITNAARFGTEKAQGPLQRAQLGLYRAPAGRRGILIRSHLLFGVRKHAPDGCHQSLEFDRFGIELVAFFSDRRLQIHRAVCDLAHTLPRLIRLHFQPWGRFVMGNGISRDYQRKNQREFDGWLKANAILGSILAIGMLAMALAGLNSAGRPDAATEFSSVNASK